MNGNFNDHYAGIFSNRAFSVNTSTSMVKRLDGPCYEGIGITPEVEALYNEAEFKKGNDTRLEAALDLIDSLTR